MNEQFEVTQAMLPKRPEMVADGYNVGDKVAGRVLHAVTAVTCSGLPKLHRIL